LGVTVERPTNLGRCGRSGVVPSLISFSGHGGNMKDCPKNF